MPSRFLLSMAIAASMFLPSQAFAADATKAPNASIDAAVSAKDECQADKDCKDGQVCILVLTPHACKAPQPAGSNCKRNAVCVSKKCDMTAGKDYGTCK